jgi:hypothetical protein
MTNQAANENSKDSVKTDVLTPNAKDVSTYPGNAEGSVQSSAVVAPKETERENTERERIRLEEERKHHEETGS